MRRSRLPRLARGTLAASTATFIALLSHVTGGGAVPGWLGIVLPWTLSLMICTLLAGRRLSLLRLALAVGASQVLFHALFVLGTFTPSAQPIAGHVHGTAHAHAAAAVHAHGTAAIAVAAPDAVMLFWHGVAAVVTVAALYRGERAARRLGELASALLSWVRRRILPVLVPVRPAVALGTRPRAADDARPATPLFGSSLRRRGPPLVRPV